ncbi:MAG TPA: M20/M25/M40 family metallo-hydrolase [Planctomycetota bacterium]|nr:M20/M25/M40 family metallo-hydrolase [Planctomycetota bacterium]
MMRPCAALFVVVAGCSAPGGGVAESNLKATVEKLVSFGTRNSISTKGVGEAAAWLKGEFERIPRLRVEYHEFTDPNPRLRRDGVAVPQKNVIATLRGTKRPDEVIVFGAHYDSLNLGEKNNPDAIAPGANDNATGTAGVLEAARILSQDEHDRTIIFACFSAEEQGLIGAFHFAKHLKESGIKVVCMLNNDIIGGAKDDDGKPLNDNSLRCYSAPPQESDSRRFARLAKLVVERRMPDFKVTIHDTIDRPKRGGDHQSFNKHGFTAIRFIEAVETDKLHHTAGDVIDRIHFPYHARVVRADIALLSNLASAPPTPEAPQVSRSTGTTSIQWKEVENAASYLLAVRGDGLEFERIESMSISGLWMYEERPVSVCVAAVDARGNVSLFSPEVTLAVRK